MNCGEIIRIDVGLCWGLTQHYPLKTRAHAILPGMGHSSLLDVASACIHAACERYTYVLVLSVPVF